MQQEIRKIMSTIVLSVYPLESYSGLSHVRIIFLDYCFKLNGGYETNQLEQDSLLNWHGPQQFEAYVFALTQDFHPLIVWHMQSSLKIFILSHCRCKIIYVKWILVLFLGILKFLLIDRLHEPFQQFLQGLNSLNCLDILSANPKGFSKFFLANASSLHADDVKNMFKEERSEEGSVAYLLEDEVLRDWQIFLNDVEGTFFLLICHFLDLLH